MQKARAFIARQLVRVALRVAPTNVLYFYEFKHATNGTTQQPLVVVGGNDKYGAAVKQSKEASNAKEK